MNSSFWVSSSLALRESTSVSRRSTKTPSLLLLVVLLLALLVPPVDDSFSLSFLLFIFLFDVSRGNFSSGISFSSLSSSSSSSSLSSSS